MPNRPLKYKKYHGPPSRQTLHSQKKREEQRELQNVPRAGPEKLAVVDAQPTLPTSSQEESLSISTAQTNHEEQLCQLSSRWPNNDELLSSAESTSGDSNSRPLRNARRKRRKKSNDPRSNELLYMHSSESEEGSVSSLISDVSHGSEHSSIASNADVDNQLGNILSASDEEVLLLSDEDSMCSSENSVSFPSDTEVPACDHDHTTEVPACDRVHSTEVPACDRVHSPSNDDEVFEECTGVQQSACLCPCTDVTLNDLYVRVLTLGLRHNLTWVAQEDILKLVASIFKNSTVPATKYHFWQRLNIGEKAGKKGSGTSSAKDIITRHIYCKKCESYLGPVEESEKEKICDNAACKMKIPVNMASNYFLSLSMEIQVKRFLSDDKFVNLILTDRVKKGPADSVLSDICDGAVYQKLVADGVLSSPYNFSYTFFTDGVAYGKSGKKSIWPIYLTFNEIPYGDRFKYMILVGIYVGTHPGQFFFLPFVEEANRLSTIGFQWEHNKRSVTSKIIPLCCVVDSGARFKILNFQTFHAKYGCTFCYQESVRVDKKHVCYKLQNAPSELRTEASLYSDLCDLNENMETTQNYELSHRGVKGPCTLMNLEYFSGTQGFVVDYMHAVCLGVVKNHLILSLDPTIGKTMWIGMKENRIGMDHLISALDSRIETVQSSTSSYKHLRKMSYQANWTAREYLVWIIFYCLPCVKGLMKEKHVLHLSLLSAAVYILLQKSITVHDLEKAHKFLWWYAYYYEKFFGLKRMVYNIHLLSHIITSVKNFGPVWGYSAFPFEAQNKYILSLSKNHSSTALEIATKFTAYQSLPRLCSDLKLSLSTGTFINSIVNHKMLSKCIRGFGNCLYLGKPVDHNSVTNKCLSLNSQNVSTCLYYKRIIYQSNIYSTIDYCSSTSRNDSCVMLISGEFALVHNFIALADKSLLADVQIIKLQRQPIISHKLIKVRHIMEVESLGERKCVTIDNFQEPMYFIKCGGLNYVMRIPYGCTVE